MIKKLFMFLKKKKKLKIKSDIIPLGVSYTVVPKEYWKEFILNDVSTLSKNIITI